jgi:quercetin 2,3-dioxygenase
MTKQTKGKMFLADERGLNETGWFRSWNTFNFGNYYNEHKKPFGDVYVINDDTLDSGRSLSMLIEEDSYIVLLPVIGAITYKDSTGNESLLAAGQIQVSHLEKGVTIEMGNPFKEELVNFLQIWIRAERKPGLPNFCLCTYDVNEFQNCLLKISPQRIGEVNLPFAISIGKFSGRGETTIKTADKNKGQFVFVVAGAFEVDGRLLHERDGLALWDTDEIEMEALSNDAIILSIE